VGRVGVKDREKDHAVARNRRYLGMTATEPSGIAIKDLAADDRRNAHVRLPPHPEPGIQSGFLVWECALNGAPRAGFFLGAKCGDLCGSLAFREQDTPSGPA
jgi:hypothetical protein